MRVVVVDYGSGNLHSALKALERAGRDAGLNLDVGLAATGEEVAAADRILLPGVGAFAACEEGLRARPGVVEALEEAVLQRGRPFLGVCVGMQLLAEKGLEFGEHPGLNWLGGEVRRLTPSDPALKIPHMGWNALRILRPHPLFAGLAPETQAYFVHSYHLVPARAEDVAAQADYGGAVTAAVARDNLAGLQFHPEKSQAAGLRILTNFLNWRP
ncbi:imidazole glycerol phosphate synthase subunit HisH [Neomegalonema perideroedes]|uniref:imidazole glycerol phosphate synthase subunit HisH n=1 Tax=Neomegalonema perideroedes TaxID=217219 RepID=UPI00047552AB|nr:imidazole glycerol phosphate synthase subunit HisH [Neomegalonema perideroedes]